jgi:uncharacterized UPF0160 family protein
MEKQMAMEYVNTIMVIDMKDNGKMIYSNRRKKIKNIIKSLKLFIH